MGKSSPVWPLGASVMVLLFVFIYCISFSHLAAAFL